MKDKSKAFESIYKFNNIFGKIEEVFAIITLWALVVVCMVFILSRFIFHVSTPWADESARYILILLGWMGAAFAASNNDHLNIDIISGILEKRSKNPEKILNVIDKVAQGLSAVFLIGFMYFYIQFVLKMADMGTPSSTLPFNMWVPMSLIIIGGVLMLVHTICYLILPKKYWSKETANENEIEEVCE